jgi:hypothetical protein
MKPVKPSGEGARKKTGPATKSDPATVAPPPVEDIPVLTEIVSRPAEAAKPPAAALSAADLGEIERRLNEIVAPLLSKFIEDSLKSQIEEQLRRSLATLVKLTGTEIEVLIRETIAQAVKSEMARLREPVREPSSTTSRNTPA